VSWYVKLLGRNLISLGADIVQPFGIVALAAESPAAVGIDGSMHGAGAWSAWRLAKPWHRASNAANDVECNVLVRESVDDCVVGDIASPAPLAKPWEPSEPCASDAVFNVMNEMVQTGGPLTAEIGWGSSTARLARFDDGDQQRSARMFCRPALIANNSPAVTADDAHDAS
jgi:hypothetical protein